MSKRRKRESVTHIMMRDVVKKFESIEHDLTRKSYIRNMKKFVVFIREKYDVKDIGKGAEFIQSYIDNLVEQGLSSSSVHTYLAPICRYYGIRMNEFSKPVRHAYDFSRGRTPKKTNKRNSQKFDNPDFSRVIEFQKRVGIRREELRKLRKEDFVKDSSGYWGVLVRVGKGGKRNHIQRILPEDVEFVKKYFDEAPENTNIFSESELNNDLNLHYYRALHAQKFYQKTIERLENDEKYREQLQKEVIKRWQTNKDIKTGKVKYLSPDKLEGKIYLRGGMRHKIIEAGRSTSFDRLAVLSTSMFCL